MRTEWKNWLDFGNGKHSAGFINNVISESIWKNLLHLLNWWLMSVNTRNVKIVSTPYTYKQKRWEIGQIFDKWLSLYLSWKDFKFNQLGEQLSVYRWKTFNSKELICFLRSILLSSHRTLAVQHSENKKRTNESSCTTSRRLWGSNELFCLSK